MHASIKQKIFVEHSLLSKIKSGFDTLQRWIERNDQHQQLNRLSDHMLKDIGLSRADVYREVNKPFWK